MEEMGFSIVGLEHQTIERGRDGEDWNRSFYFYEEEHQEKYDNWFESVDNTFNYV